ncbi:hypothetical protein QYE76_048259 [Lolium multiflorum]|uniref:Reverse transcriptase domain-containing protein n=1 Tax=Lolium multiflorum TaxID=4521 RepID=A0AAD8VB20_LOLMU|nr:hypothetical protein QYE76_048259 [Lolium multiflorum]
MTELKAKLTRLSSSLDVWGRNTFGSVQKEIRELEYRLGVMQSSTDRHGPSEEESLVVGRLSALYQREETMWRQRSRVQWLAEGDKNTRFFHLRASQRKKKNRVARLKKPDGSFTEDDGEMAQLTGEFYEDLYRSEGVSNMEEVIDVIPRKVTAQMNDNLLKPIKGEEVKSALFQMFPTKAPGPDGFPAHFFQTHWDLCGEEVTAAVLRVLRGEDNMAEINHTFVVLIPKVASPEELGQLGPINLCNVIYKIASKVMANRLKVVLPEIIAEEQSAFVPGRLITDNIITAYECLHFMKRNKAKKNRYCALKLDMRKAYDRLEWRYLEAVMIKLGFHRLWVQMSYLKDLELSKRTVQKPAAVTATTAPRWIPPPPGMVKINVDAAVGKNLRRGSVAAIARSSDGVFLGASALIYAGVTEAETLEALACREACDLARDIYASRAIHVRMARKHARARYLHEETKQSNEHIVTELVDIESPGQQEVGQARSTGPHSSG